MIFTAIRQKLTDKKYRLDLIVILILLVLGLLLFAYLHFSSQPGSEVVVSIMGDEVARFPLDEDTTYLIKSDYGTNKLVIYDHMAFFEDADCPDKLCVLQGTISLDSESIVCLPHGVIAEIVDESKH